MSWKGAGFTAAIALAVVVLNEKRMLGFAGGKPALTEEQRKALKAAGFPETGL